MYSTAYVLQRRSMSCINSSRQKCVSVNLICQSASNADGVISGLIFARASV